MNKHRHTWKPFSHCGRKITFRCSCKETQERDLTQEEQTLWKRTEDLILKDLHNIWHIWLRTMINKHGEYKYLGYDLMQEADKFQKKYPDRVRIANCDDDIFTSSYLVFVSHGTGDNYMGETVVFIPQNDGTPTTFFLYPSHVDSILRTIEDIRKNPGTQSRATRSTRSSVRREMRRPSSFDVFNKRYKRKKWWVGKLIDDQGNLLS